jgi:hypothetical protein
MEYVLFTKDSYDGTEPWHTWLRWDGNEAELGKLQELIYENVRNGNQNWYAYKVTENVEPDATIRTLIGYAHGGGGLGEYGPFRHGVMEGKFTCPASLDIDGFPKQLRGCFEEPEPTAPERLVRLFEWEPDYGFCAENLKTNRELAAALEKVRRKVCTNIGDGIDGCDCKYGARPQGSRSSSEKTGCPELREVINRLLRRPETFAATTS